MFIKKGVESRSDLRHVEAGGRSRSPFPRKSLKPHVFILGKVIERYFARGKQLWWPSLTKPLALLVGVARPRMSPF